MNLCKNCSTPVSEKFCGRCGEKVYITTDKSFKHLFEEAFHFLTHFEGKFFTTLLTMLKRPGKLSVDFCDGIRKKYFKPLSFYLLLIIAYLLFPMFEALNMKVQYYYKSNLYGAYAKEKAEEVKEKRNYTEEKLTEAFQQKGEKTSKFMLFVILPLLGLFSYGLLFWKRKFFFDHFIFATESASFYLLYGFLLIPLLLVIASLLGLKSFFSEWIFALIIYAGTGTYAALAARRFFTLHWTLSVLYGFLFGWTLFLVVQYPYKFLLFYVVIHLL